MCVIFHPFVISVFLCVLYGQVAFSQPVATPPQASTNMTAPRKQMLSGMTNWTRTADGKLQVPIKAPEKAKSLLPDLKPEQPLVTVNGSSLSWGSMKRYGELMLSEFSLPPGVTAEEFEAEKDNILLRNILKMTESFITKTVLAQEAVKHKLQPTSAEREAKHKELSELFSKTRKYPERFLKELNTPGSFLQSELSNSLLIACLTRDVIRPSIQVSEPDIAEHIKQQDAKNQELLAYNASLRPKITALLKRIQGGEKFADIASKESDCPTSEKGGEWGTFKRDDLRPEIMDVVFAMEEGSLSDVIETPFSFHIVKLHKKNRGFSVEGATNSAPVVSVKIAHIMLEKKELLPNLNNASAKEELVASRAKKALAELKVDLIRAAKIESALPLFDTPRK